MRNLLDFLLKYNYWFVFIFLEIISFGLLFHFNNYQGSAFYTSANNVVGTIYNAQNELTSYFYLKTVNEDLVQRNVELELQLEAYNKKLQDLTEDTVGISRLKNEVLGDYTIIKANVINNSINRTDNYITINRGAKSGIKSEMGVVSGNGVVGIVYLTSENYSVVLPILNSKSNISCKLKNSGYFGFLKWNGGSSEFAYLKDMPRYAKVKVGDTIVTSGHSAVFPSGMPVGIIKSISNTHDGLSYDLKVKMFTDFAKLNEIRVIYKNDDNEQVNLEKSIETTKR